MLNNLIKVKGGGRGVIISGGVGEGGGGVRSSYNRTVALAHDGGRCVDFIRVAGCRQPAGSRRLQPPAVDAALASLRVDPFLDKQNINNAFLSKHARMYARARARLPTALEEVSAGV